MALPRRAVKADAAELDAVPCDVVVALSWWGRADKPGTSDTQGVVTDRRVRAALNAAERNRVPVAWHLEPYPGRTAEDVAEDVRYLEETYGDSPAVYREGGEAVFFVYDSYHVAPDRWRAALLTTTTTTTEKAGGGAAAAAATVVGRQARPGRALPGVLIGLWLERSHGADLEEAGFDGFYTYFASKGFVHGSDPRHWPTMVAEAKRRKLVSVLSVGPGYRDDRIRPWNAHHTQDRKRGSYYQGMMWAALDARPDALSVTSYNEWGEGTQIEPAVAYAPPASATAAAAAAAAAPPLSAAEGGDGPVRPPHSGYEDYSMDEGHGLGPYMYLNLTAKWAGAFAKQKREEDEAAAAGRGDEL